MVGFKLPVGAFVTIAGRQCMHIGNGVFRAGSDDILFVEGDGDFVPPKSEEVSHRCPPKLVHAAELIHAAPTQTVESGSPPSGLSERDIESGKQWIDRMRRRRTAVTAADRAMVRRVLGVDPACFSLLRYDLQEGTPLRLGDGIGLYVGYAEVILLHGLYFERDVSTDRRVYPSRSATDKIAGL